MANAVPVAVNARSGHPDRVDGLVGLPEVFGEAFGAGGLIGPGGEVGFEFFHVGDGGQGGFHPGFEVVECTFEGVEMFLWVSKEAEVRGGEIIYVNGAEAGQALTPLFEVEFGGGGRDADVGGFGEADAGDIACEAEVFEKVGHVMGGVAGGVEGGELQGADRDGISVREGGEFVGGDGEEISPKGFHRVAINAGGTDKETVRVEEVWRADFVDVDVGTLLGQPACCAGMIQVDVGEEGVGDVRRGEAVGAEGGGEAGNGGAWAGFDEDAAAGMGNEEGGDGVRLSLEVEVEDMKGGHRGSS